MGGPITGVVTEIIDPGVIQRAFLPLLHNRAPRLEDPEYRAGVSPTGISVDEARRQILGDFALRISQLCLERRVDFSHVAAVADEAAERVSVAYKRNIQNIYYALNKLGKLAEDCSWLDPGMRAGLKSFIHQVAKSHTALEPRTVVRSSDAEQIVSAFRHIPSIFRTWKYLMGG
jgi:hypothetical protein